MRISLAFISPKEQIELEEAIFYICLAIRHKERSIENVPVKEAYEINLQLYRHGPKDSIFGVAIKEETFVELGTYSLPEGISFADICQYIYWRVNQLLLAMQTKDYPHLELTNDPIPEKASFVQFLVKHQYKYELEVDLDCLSLDVVNDGGKSTHIGFITFNSKTKRWRMKELLTKEIPEFIISDGLKYAQATYPEGYPNQQ